MVWAIRQTRTSDRICESYVWLSALAGVLKDPQGAGRIIAEAITHAETPIAAAKTPEGKVGPKSETAAETKDETKAKAPANLTSKIAK
jgi:hypothetical protein